MTNEKQNLADWEAAVRPRAAFSFKIKKAASTRNFYGNRISRVRAMLVAATPGRHHPL
jgi:hypothetical protein